jgi:hypothetical protein
LGYRLPKVTETSVDEISMIEETLPSRALWKTFFADMEAPRALSWERARAMSLAIVYPFPSFLFSLPLIMALAFAAQARYLPRLHTCASCGKTICRKCHYRVQRESFCSDCFSIRQRVRAPMQREEELSKRRKKVRRAPWLWGLTLAALVPGAGHLHQGRRGWAMFLLFAWLSFLSLSADSHASASWELPSATVPAILLLFALISITGYIRCASGQGAHASRKV